MSLLFELFSLKRKTELFSVSDAPPVGSYDLPEIELRAIKILEKSNNPLKTIDETGNGDKENVRIRTNSFQPDKLSKLNEKLESKLHKLELKNEELLRVQSLSKAELSQLKAELSQSPLSFSLHEPTFYFLSLRTTNYELISS